MIRALLISVTVSASLTVRAEQSSGTAEFQKKVALALQDWAHNTNRSSSRTALHSEKSRSRLASSGWSGSE
jgi:hypothetical protein